MNIIIFAGQVAAVIFLASVALPILFVIFGGIAMFLESMVKELFSGTPKDPKNIFGKVLFAIVMILIAVILW